MPEKLVCENPCHMHIYTTHLTSTSQFKVISPFQKLLLYIALFHSKCLMTKVSKTKKDTLIYFDGVNMSDVDKDMQNYQTSGFLIWKEPEVIRIKYIL